MNAISAPRRAALRLTVAVSALAACLAAMLPPAAAAEAGLALSGSYLRTIIPSRPAAGYFTLTNNGATERTLVGASSPACGMLMLHKSVRENGVDKMLPVKSIPVPAHGRVTFAPGGFHLMCMQPAATVRPGASVSVTLTFKDGTTLSGTFPVRSAGAN